MADEVSQTVDSGVVEVVDLVVPSDIVVETYPDDSGATIDLDSPSSDTSDHPDDTVQPDQPPDESDTFLHQTLDEPASSTEPLSLSEAEFVSGSSTVVVHDDQPTDSTIDGLILIASTSSTTSLMSTTTQTDLRDTSVSHPTTEISPLPPTDTESSQGEANEPITSVDEDAAMIEDQIEVMLDAGDSVASSTDSLQKNQSMTENAVAEFATSSVDFDAGLPGVFDATATNVTESDEIFSFSRSECTVVEDGSYYCQKAPEVATGEDRLIAAPDSDGDLEIYLQRSGVSTQLTYNAVDDAAPYYDHYSDTIVWHRLINDRYQIMSYDIQSATEVQITNGQTNNMEPARNGEYIVWQRWVDTNWEIILFDGEREQQITKSTAHDIAPHMRGSLVIWNTRFDDGRQQLQTYDISERTYTVIKDSDGVTVSNPRMVVMYEAMYANGDIVTKGFDLVSGESVPLEALPRQLPDSLPSSEPTGEVRALLPHKSTEPQGDELEPDAVPELDPPLDSESVALEATSAPELELDLRLTSSSSASALLPPTDQGSTTVVHIPDVIIEPLAEIATSTQL